MELETNYQLEPNRDGDQMPSWREVFLYFLMLGFINIGGPVAQITMMYNHMVERRHWLSEDRFVKIMAFCHMLPGPEAPTGPPEGGGARVAPPVCTSARAVSSRGGDPPPAG